MVFEEKGHMRRTRAVARQHAQRQRRERRVRRRREPLTHDATQRALVDDVGRQLGVETGAEQERDATIVGQREQDRTRRCAAPLVGAVDARLVVQLHVVAVGDSDAIVRVRRARCRLVRVIVQRNDELSQRRVAQRVALSQHVDRRLLRRRRRRWRQQRRRDARELRRHAFEQAQRDERLRHVECMATCDVERAKGVDARERRRERSGAKLKQQLAVGGRESLVEQSKERLCIRNKKPMQSVTSTDTHTEARAREIKRPQRTRDDDAEQQRTIRLANIDQTRYRRLPFERRARALPRRHCRCQHLVQQQSNFRHRLSFLRFVLSIRD